MSILELALIILLLMWAFGGIAYPLAGSFLNILLVIVIIVLIFKIIDKV